MPWLPKCLPPTSKVSTASLNPKSRSSGCPLTKEPNQFSSSPKFCRSIIVSFSPPPSLLSSRCAPCWGLAPRSLYTRCFSTSWIARFYKTLHMCATLENYPCPMYEIINFNETMFHFVLFHDAACYTNSLLSRIHVNTT
jgi:hypothetical protein